MADTIARFVHNGGYALSVVHCTDVCQEIAVEQNKVFGDALPLFCNTITSALLLGTRLKGPGTLSLSLESNGFLRQLRADAIGLGRVRGLIKRSVQEESWKNQSLLKDISINVERQLQEDESPYRSTVQSDATDVRGAINDYLQQSEQVSAVCLPECGCDENNVRFAAGLYLERLPGHEENDERCEALLRGEIPEENPPFVNSDQEMVDYWFGEGTFNHLRRYDVSFFCPCSAERYKTTLRRFDPKQLRELADEDGLLNCVCDFCRSSYDIELNDLIDE